MTRWPVLVYAAQVVYGLAAAGLTYHDAGSLWRVIRRKAVLRDISRAFICLFGIGQLGFILRWLFLGRAEMARMPAFELRLWFLLYIFGAGTMIGLLYTWGDRAPPANSRAARALALWAIVFALSCALVTRG